MKLEKLISEAVENILTNNFEIIDKQIVRLVENEVMKALEQLLKDRVRTKVIDIIEEHSQRIIERSQEILLVYEGGDSDLKEVNNVAERHLDQVEADMRNKVQRKKGTGEE
jgi:hypothetical protein